MSARTIRRALGLVLAVVVPVAGWVAVDTWTYGMGSDPGPADAALVLGAAVAGDRPTPVFTERLRHAVDLYASGRVRMLVMTGGRNPSDALGEAEAGRDWAIAAGVLPEAILVETSSRTTRQNIDFAKPILAEHGLTRVLVVSDPLHLRRAVTMARDAGIDARPSPTPTSRYATLGTQVPMLMREVWFSFVYRLTGQ
ncbi:YdcF family protein [Devosia sp. ZB163]|uniref:YdcF family protein n=1 Tax=Devosia sp. ZB163 TaxID=3025938 RepID=UPI00235E82BF|nr:YdcF family protein [Devosia sp. ZB163]MDC9826531.1 YdcF family protein [Devosia sp. ZB163]